MMAIGSYQPIRKAKTYCVFRRGIRYFKHLVDRRQCHLIHAQLDFAPCAVDSFKSVTRQLQRGQDVPRPQGVREAIEGEACRIYQLDYYLDVATKFKYTSPDTN
jgi:hypothetical protein